ncbi:hypothetical protein EOS93_12250 [Rhizobium sp. RMa-01]|nr:hypothetical protein EOS93_12250 [Rhizobium sp. RMa-01]
MNGISTLIYALCRGARKSASRNAAGIGLAQFWCKITGSC